MFKYQFIHMNEKILFLVRHAKSSWKDPALSDHDRPLNQRGKQNAPLMAARLRKEEFSQNYSFKHCRQSG